jgi:hypothetical protein
MAPVLAGALDSLFSRYGAAGAVNDYGWTISRPRPAARDR